MMRLVCYKSLLYETLQCKKLFIHGKNTILGTKFGYLLPKVPLLRLQQTIVDKYGTMGYY